MARRVAIVTDWFAPRRGGIEAQLLELAERLGSRDNEVDVITATRGAVDGRCFRVRPLNVRTVPPQDVALSPMLLPALRRELGRGYDVVHAHVSVVSPVGWLGAFVGRSLGLPTVVTFHSVLRAKAILLRMTDAVADLGASGITWTAVSRLVAGQASRALGGAEVSLLRNGIDLPWWSAVQPEHGSQLRWPTLVSTMRLQRKKRPRELLRAFASAARKTTDGARLLIIGDGPERAALERDIHELGLVGGAARAAVLGWLDRDAIRSTYSAADGFVLASTRESFGIAALEARAAGLPVIAMRGGSSEFLTHGVDALICDDDADLARAIGAFLGDPTLRANLRDHSPSLAEYDWPAVLTAHEVTFARATARASASTPAGAGTA